MTIRLVRGGRDLAERLAPVLDAWTGAAPLTAQLHSGDLGWHLRLDDETIADGFWSWEADGAPVAVGLAEQPVLRTAVHPGLHQDANLATAVADAADGFGYVDAPSGSAAQRELAGRGWSVEPSPWVLLYADLGPVAAAYEDPDTRPVDSVEDVEARTAVQRSAFAPGSTFTPELWDRMSTGPTYDARFEMVTWTPSGEPAAAATGWFAGAGRCAILEPVGTHQEHQRKGYGRRVNLGVMAALAAAGASGIRVHTPVSNAAAVATYESCGLRQVAWTTDLKPPPSG